MSEWMPIESAPKDGTPVLVYPPLWMGRTCSIARFNDGRFAKNPGPYWSRDDDMGRVAASRGLPPTHWMPCPEPPKGE